MKFDIVMSVRREFEMDPDQIDDFVENQCYESPEEFIGPVNRSDFDWWWYEVEEPSPFEAHGVSGYEL